MAATSLYKSPEEYLAAAIAKVQAQGSKITDFSIESAARALYEGLAAMLSEHSLVVDQLRSDSYLATAVGAALDRKAGDYQVGRKAAQMASGTIRLTRQATGTAVTIPAGFGDLVTTPAPGLPSIAFRTTENAVFGTADTFKVVAAVAVVGGAAGNIAANTGLLFTTPVAGFAVDGGAKAETTFGGGVDAESDDALRFRVPLEVQARVKGRKESFLAAALRIPGVESAQVLQAGDTKPDTSTVPGGNVFVYYEGAAGLLAAVQTECSNAAVAGQLVTVVTATAKPVIADLTVFCDAGVDVVALAAAVKAAVLAVVNVVGVGGSGRSSNAIRAVQQIEEVVSQTIPWTDLRFATATDNTFGDLVAPVGSYPTLALVDVAVTVSVLP